MDIDEALSQHELHESLSTDSLASNKNNKAAGAPSKWRPTSGHFGLKAASKYSNSFDNLASPMTPRDLGQNLASLRRAQSVKDVGQNDAPMPMSTTDLTSAILGASSIEILQTTSTTSPQQTESASITSQSVAAAPAAAARPPVLRSRSSYSFQSMSNLLTLSNLTRHLRKQSTIDGTIQIPLATATVAPSSTSTGNPRPTPKVDTSLLKDKDGFLKDISSRGFSGLWNHPITRCYFLMFLLWRNLENLYYFRMDAQNFRVDFPYLYSSARKSQAYRIYNTYLSRTSPMYILRQIPEHYQLARNVIDKIKLTLESPTPILFDDMAFVVLNWLHDIHDGAPISDSPQLPSSDKDAAPASPTAGQPFIETAFFQAMRNDLRGTRHLTTIQYNRAAERITDMPPFTYESGEVWEKLMTTLEVMGVDCERFRARGAGASLHRKSSQKESGKATTSRSRSASSMNDPRRPLTPDSPDEMTANVMKDWKRTSTNQLNPVVFASNDLAHTFVQYSGTDQLYCEYCFNPLDAPISTYRCESCGYMCHKQCRKETHVSCVKPSTALDVEDQSEVLSEKMARSTEKMQAIQREIDIESKIRDGLNNLRRAKGELGKSSKKPMPVEVDSQMERSDRKLEALKHELQKCRLQLAALSAAAAAAANISAAPRDEVGDATLGGHRRMGSASTTVLQNISADGEVVKIVTMDSARKAESTKTFYVTTDTTIKQLITMALQKFMFSGNAEDYRLSYKTADAEEVPLRHEDHPFRLGLNLIDTPFRLTVNFDSADPTGGTTSPNAKPAALTREDAIRQRKEREVLLEIAETEINYTADLHNIVALFFRPLSVATVLTHESEANIFANLKELADTHQSIANALQVMMPDIMTKDMLTDIISLFSRHVDSLAAYEVYCRNQHNARRTLARLKEDPTFLKILTQCESNPKLNKLSLADLLVKPMHRVTRYPILFKRLLSNLPKATLEHEVVNELINGIEEKVAGINESVRKWEADWRIHVIEDSLDFNGVVEVGGITSPACRPHPTLYTDRRFLGAILPCIQRFKVANGRRELITEKTFTYLKKNTNGTVEVSVLFFTDLLMIIRSKKAADSYLLFRPPIPLEAAVFLDKPDADGMKNIFRIVHLHQETHSFQAISAYDKNTWLTEAEAIRMQFCLLHYSHENNLLALALKAYSHDSDTTTTSAPLSPTPNDSKTPGTGTMRRRYTASPRASVRKHTQSVDLTPSEQSSVISEDSPGTTTTGADVKRAGSWAHMLKSSFRKANPLTQTMLDASSSEDVPALPMRSASESGLSSSEPGLGGSLGGSVVSEVGAAETPPRRRGGKHRKAPSFSASVGSLVDRTGGTGTPPPVSMPLERDGSVGNTAPSTATGTISEEDGNHVPGIPPLTISPSAPSSVRGGTATQEVHKPRKNKKKRLSSLQFVYFEDKPAKSPDNPNYHPVEVVSPDGAAHTSTTNETVHPTNVITSPTARRNNSNTSSDPPSAIASAPPIQQSTPAPFPSSPLDLTNLADRKNAARTVSLPDQPLAEGGKGKKGTLGRHWWTSWGGRGKGSGSGSSAGSAAGGSQNGG
ncbi:uncharacterized protein EV422DRAFT_267552 [Fimicolochytrium jonesii]|uniref:uncharacterized protein n=1 Tax=Fimicolochytrium jonesii TaxID=1396493 RepID=UPI0022FEC050|nr:uncharacterized protein EV422DRAFT_267552 [Fimicolochytrium jonesii]KAI8816965.1 hypothetical protein EV422DRAFT_267552 [Fimicolochytrium jonesii]